MQPPACYPGRWYIPVLIEISGWLDHCVVDWLSDWRAAEICFFVEHKTLHLEGGRERGREGKRKKQKNITCKKKKNTIRLLCK